MLPQPGSQPDMKEIQPSAQPQPAGHHFGQWQFVVDDERAVSLRLLRRSTRVALHAPHGARRSGRGGARLPERRNLQQIFTRLIPIPSCGWVTLTVEEGLACAG